MRFKIDENLPTSVTTVLSNADHNVTTVFEEDMVGVSDYTLSNQCKSEKRILITLDLDFADIRAYPPGKHPGIVVIRLKSQDKITIIHGFQRLIKAFEENNPAGKLWIVEEERIRIRE